ncbi:MAG: hypothetical protein WDM89_04505 [Rhizomicrobium sp.]
MPATGSVIRGWLIEWVIGHTGAKPGDAAMDLGCGPGAARDLPFALAGLKVFGIDPEPAMLEEGQKAAADAGVSGRVPAGEFLRSSHRDRAVQAGDDGDGRFTGWIVRGDLKRAGRARDFGRRCGPDA